MRGFRWARFRPAPISVPRVDCHCRHWRLRAQSVLPTMMASWRYLAGAGKTENDDGMVDSQHPRCRGACRRGDMPVSPPREVRAGRCDCSLGSDFRLHDESVGKPSRRRALAEVDIKNISPGRSRGRVCREFGFGRAIRLPTFDDRSPHEALARKGSHAPVLLAAQPSPLRGTVLAVAGFEHVAPPGQNARIQADKSVGASLGCSPDEIGRLSYVLFGRRRWRRQWRPADADHAIPFGIKDFQPDTVPGTGDERDESTVVACHCGQCAPFATASGRAENRAWSWALSAAVSAQYSF